MICQDRQLLSHSVRRPLNTGQAFQELCGLRTVYHWGVAVVVVMEGGGGIIIIRQSSSCFACHSSAPTIVTTSSPIDNPFKCLCAVFFNHWFASFSHEVLSWLLSLYSLTKHTVSLLLLQILYKSFNLKKKLVGVDTKWNGRERIYDYFVPWR